MDRTHTHRRERERERNKFTELILILLLQVNSGLPDLQSSHTQRRGRERERAAAVAALTSALSRSPSHTTITAASNARVKAKVDWAR
jgi:hypothetical protein